MYYNYSTQQPVYPPTPIYEPQQYVNQGVPYNQQNVQHPQYVNPSDSYNQPIIQQQYVSEPYNQSYVNPSIPYNITPELPPPTEMGERDWSHPLCDCLNDFEICISSLFCFGCQTVKTTERMDDNKMDFGSYMMGTVFCVLTCFVGAFCCQSAVEMTTREDFSKKYNIRNNGNNCLVSFCCLPCVVCQHAQEIKYLEENNLLIKKKKNNEFECDD